MRGHGGNTQRDRPDQRQRQRARARGVQEQVGGADHVAGRVVRGPRLEVHPGGEHLVRLDARHQPRPQRPVAEQDDGQRDARRHRAHGVEQQVLALAAAHRSGGHGEDPVVGDTARAPHPRALVRRQQAGVRDAVGHDHQAAVGPGEPPVALALQVRDRDRPRRHPAPQQDLRGTPEPVRGVRGQVLDRVERRHQRQRRAAPEPGGQPPDHVRVPAVRVHQVDAVLAQHPGRPPHRTRVPRGQPQLDDRDPEAPQPRDLPPVTGRPEHHHDGLDAGGAGDGCEVHELVTRAAVLDEGADEVGNLHGESSVDVHERVGGPQTIPIRSPCNRAAWSLTSRLPAAVDVRGRSGGRPATPAHARRAAGRHGRGPSRRDDQRPADRPDRRGCIGVHRAGVAAG